MNHHINDIEANEVKIKWLEEETFKKAINIVAFLLIVLQVAVLFFHFFKGHRNDLSFAILYGVLMLYRNIGIYRSGGNTKATRNRIVSYVFCLLACFIWQIIFVFEI